MARVANAGRTLVVDMISVMICEMDWNRSPYYKPCCELDYIELDCCKLD